MFQVSITQQNAKARLDISDPLLHLKTTDLAVQISSEPAKMEIHSPAAELSIDNYPSDRSRGIKNNVDFDRDNAQKGLQTVYAAIGKIASEGVRLSKIEHKGHPLAQLAKAAMDSKPVEISVGSVAEPTIKVTPHQAEVNVQPGRLNISFSMGRVDGDLQKGTVNLAMLQYPEVNFRFTDTKVNLKV